MRQPDPLDMPYSDYEDEAKQSDLEAGYIQHGKLNQPTDEVYLDFGWPPESNSKIQKIKNRSRNRESR